MKCIDDNKGHSMNLIKKILPFVVALLVGGGIAYLFIPKAQKKIDETAKAVKEKVADPIAEQVGNIAIIN